jgi:transcription elongation factor GreA
MSDEAPTYPVTREGLARLREELDHLVNEERPALAQRLRAAIQQGDLSENADYHDAKEQQGFLEARIRQLEEMIKGAVIIEETGPSDTVRLGSRATVVEGKGPPETFVIVGQAEASPREGRISNESPLGKALLGHKVGDQVSVAAPDGDLIFEISAIE